MRPAGASHSVRVGSREGAAPLQVRPATLKAAMKWCATVHRRLPRLQGGLWAVSAARGCDVVGFAIVGVPRARMLAARGWLEVARVAVLPGDAAPSGNKGACSVLYAACARAARGMCAAGLITYTHLDEPGTSLRAAGWRDAGLTDGGEWDRDGRPRQLALDPEQKRRWVAPWSEPLRSAA